MTYVLDLRREGDGCHWDSIWWSNFIDTCDSNYDRIKGRSIKEWDAIYNDKLNEYDAHVNRSILTFESQEAYLEFVLVWS